MATDDNARPAANGTGEKQAGQPESIVTDVRAAERSRRSRRWARRELDELLDVPEPEIHAVDYSGMGFDLGVSERTVAGRALRERAA
ncbi:hypothetical protein [Actinoplanes teichomyceticus]|uniref:Uncharacterized protein n=1 Tax=Actinoplanes teichomyceticus TaxID=1867 RepID=A0A561WI94_ACTTI|nr:hypothetical protein [Actinoplanes teichomyceticus]TWG23578.1 hypothetical protein FHX34_102127 [Actinoplanes teichomyceticus]GIF16204.1 hypothetical protein Ate01nite_62360 [Actinoplanes teichomyceticus]